ncbi:type VI secretion system baseplate subunit TssK [Aquabacterium sp.]|uniref:type VI secretion system baseplate subunit TssK n=1 Tax=Aquabacterium sp. TaxID=1872578 RepID=UPI0035B46FB4
MIPSAKVLWGEGLFLRPQHFQRQDAYHEWRLAQVARAINPYAWGVRSVRVDTDALAIGQLRLLDMQALFQDGELFSAPAEDPLPAPVALDATMGAQGEETFHLVLPAMRAQGQNLIAPTGSPEASLRYTQSSEPATDWFTQAAPADISLVRKAARLLPAAQAAQHASAIPVLRVKRNTTGAFELDARFIPPSVALQSSPMLHLMLRRLMDVMQAKVDALYGLHREPSKNVIEFRSGDVASFWLLHTVSSSFAALSHVLRNPGFHPERLYQELLRLAGALMTFSKHHTLADLPAYDHGEPGVSFTQLDHIIRELLETVISTRYFAIALSETRPSYHMGRLDSEQLSANTHLYLGVSASVPPAELVDMVPARFKIGSPDDVEKLVLSAMPGVKLIAAQQVPAAIPVRPGAYYFSLEPRGVLYERMLQAQSISLYAPGSLPDLKLELLAVNS